MKVFVKTEKELLSLPYAYKDCSNGIFFTDTHKLINGTMLRFCGLSIDVQKSNEGVNGYEYRQDSPVTGMNKSWGWQKEWFYSLKERLEIL